MKRPRNLGLLIIGAIVLIFVFWGCSGYNRLITSDQNVKKSWGNVETNYQRRTDLYNSVIKTVEASANFEKSLLKDVVAARSRLLSVNVDLNDQASLDRFQQAQGQMQGAFSRLLGYVENYPDIKTTKAFQDFQTQIEGTENRINVARQDYNKSVENYNLHVKRFPNNMLAGLFGFSEKAFYRSDPGSEKNPDINFNIK
ncbi:MAG TPA: LemA family protein [Chitinophagaceae bacterium]|nr:LemA family protein [Chitinophagaceae bacterium]